MTNLYNGMGLDWIVCVQTVETYLFMLRSTGSGMP